MYRRTRKKTTTVGKPWGKRNLQDNLIRFEIKPWDLLFDPSFHWSVISLYPGQEGAMARLQMPSEWTTILRRRWNTWRRPRALTARALRPLRSLQQTLGARLEPPRPRKRLPNRLWRWEKSPREIRHGWRATLLLGERRGLQKTDFR